LGSERSNTVRFLSTDFKYNYIGFIKYARTYKKKSMINANSEHRRCSQVNSETTIHLLSHFNNYLNFK